MASKKRITTCVDRDVEEEMLVDVAHAYSALDDMVVLRSLLGGAIEKFSARQQVAVELRCLSDSSAQTLWFG